MLFAWLLERGPEPLWFVMLALAGAFALVTLRRGRVLPQAAQRVTNRADDAAAHGLTGATPTGGRERLASVGSPRQRLERSKE